MRTINFPNGITVTVSTVTIEALREGHVVVREAGVRRTVQRVVRAGGIATVKYEGGMVRQYQCAAHPLPVFAVEAD